MFAPADGSGAVLTAATCSGGWKKIPGFLKPRVSVTFCAALAIFSGVTYGPSAWPPCSAISFSCKVSISARCWIAWSLLPVPSLALFGLGTSDGVR